MAHYDFTEAVLAQEPELVQVKALVELKAKMVEVRGLPGKYLLLVHPNEEYTLHRNVVLLSPPPFVKAEGPLKAGLICTAEEAPGIVREWLESCGVDLALLNPPTPADDLPK